jgi:hypothetical protein
MRAERDVVVQSRGQCEDSIIGEQMAARSEREKREQGRFRLGSEPPTAASRAASR